MKKDDQTTKNLFLTWQSIISKWDKNPFAWSQLTNKGYSIFYSVLIFRQKILMAVFVAFRWFFVFWGKELNDGKFILVFYFLPPDYSSNCSRISSRPGRRSQCRLKKAEKENIGKRRSWFFYFTWYLPKKYFLHRV